MSSFKLSLNLSMIRSFVNKTDSTTKAVFSGTYELRPAVQKWCDLRPKTSASFVSFAPHVANCTRVCFKHRKSSRVCKVSNNLKGFLQFCCALYYSYIELYAHIHTKLSNDVIIKHVMSWYYPDALKNIFSRKVTDTLCF